MSTLPTSPNAGVLPITIRFNVPEQKIDSRTLGTVLLETTRLLERVGRNLNPDVNVTVSVAVPKPGSVEIPVELWAAGGYLLTNLVELTPYLRQLLDTALAFIELKQALRGKDPVSTETSDNKISITGDNNIITIVDKPVYQIYKRDPEAHKAVETQFKQLDHDPNIEAIEVLDEQRTVLTRVRKSDFAATYAQRRQSEQMSEPTVQQGEQTLIVTQPLLQNREGIWKFLDAEGESISARMADGGFLRSIADGEQFAMGDRLRVELEIEREYDEAIRAHKISKRRVLRVLKHFKKCEQMTLPDVTT